VLDQILSRGAFAAKALKVLTESGVIAPFGPLTLARLGRTVLEWGTGPAGGFPGPGGALPGSGRHCGSAW
jgi:hypothetical protein